MEKKDPIEEARRYVANAKEIIKNANYDPETKSYEDRKYIKAPGDILWKGCLIALDAILPIRNGKGRPSIENTKQQQESEIASFCNSSTSAMTPCTL